MDFTIVNIQYIEEIGILVDVHIQNETTLKNGTPMHQPIQMSVPLDGDDSLTIADVHELALQQASRFLRQAANFFDSES